MFLCKLAHGIEIKRVSQSMGEEYCPGSFAARRFELAYVDFVSWNGYVNEYWNQVILENRIHSGWKAGGNGDDLVSWHQPTVTEFG
jgi:hypothetical protein